MGYRLGFSTIEFNNGHGVLQEKRKIHIKNSDIDTLKTHLKT
jgi:hypothetical protein